jgi:hypothetical protein
MSAPFDFKETAKALLKRLTPQAGGSVNPALALAAVETALREAYARGQQDARPIASSRTSAPSARFEPAEEECAHVWQETFLDGKSVGSKCVKCDIIERDVKSRCDHYFVKTDSGEVCVACRKPKRGRG